jgi:hypothetical protein
MSQEFQTMFNPITIPFGAVMLYNVVKLKPGITTGDVEIAIGEMCNTVKNTYGDDKGGFIGGQVFEYTGFVSPEGSFDPERKTEDHIVIITYWNSFEQHEKSHADSVFKERVQGEVRSPRRALLGDLRAWLRDALAGRARRIGIAWRDGRAAAIHKDHTIVRPRCAVQTTNNGVKESQNAHYALFGIRFLNFDTRKTSHQKSKTCLPCARPASSSYLVG